MLTWIPFAAGAVVLLWALASFAMAANGGERAGMHEYVAERRHADADRARRRERTYRMYVWMNYALALAVIAGTIAMFGVALFVD